MKFKELDTHDFLFAVVPTAGPQPIPRIVTLKIVDIEPKLPVRDKDVMLIRIIPIPMKSLSTIPKSKWDTLPRKDIIVDREQSIAILAEKDTLPVILATNIPQLKQWMKKK